jgi:hypothetical protein
MLRAYKTVEIGRFEAIPVFERQPADTKRVDLSLTKDIGYNLVHLAVTVPGWHRLHDIMGLLLKGGADHKEVTKDRRETLHHLVDALDLAYRRPGVRPAPSIGDDLSEAIMVTKFLTNAGCAL